MVSVTVATPPEVVTGEGLFLITGISISTELTSTKVVPYSPVSQSVRVAAEELLAEPAVAPEANAVEKHIHRESKIVTTRLNIFFSFLNCSICRCMHFEFPGIRIQCSLIKESNHLLQSKQKAASLMRHRIPINNHKNFSHVAFLQYTDAAWEEI